MDITQMMEQSERWKNVDEFMSSVSQLKDEFPLLAIQAVDQDTETIRFKHWLAELAGNEEKSQLRRKFEGEARAIDARTADESRVVVSISGDEREEIRKAREKVYVLAKEKGGNIPDVERDFSGLTVASGFPGKKIYLASMLFVFRELEN